MKPELITIIFTVLWGVLLYLVNQKDKAIKELQEDVNELCIKVQDLQSRIWDETKLETVLQKVVENEFNKLRIELLELGAIPIKTRSEVK